MIDWGGMSSSSSLPMISFLFFRWGKGREGLKSVKRLKEGFNENVQFDVILLPFKFASVEKVMFCFLFKTKCFF